MSNNYSVHHQWMNRPDEERFTSLEALLEYVQVGRGYGREAVIDTKSIEFSPMEDDDMTVSIGAGDCNVTNWAFSQMATKFAPGAGNYLRTLPAELAAACLTYGANNAPREKVQMLLNTHADGQLPELRAMTGPNYGRIWDAEIVAVLADRFGAQSGSPWRVPGIQGKPLTEVTKRNTTLYAGDRDMFIFLADETNRIEMPNRRDGKTGELARGFIVRNSEVGNAALSIRFFLFDYVCANRIIWDMHNLGEINLRHVRTAPNQWLDDIMPALHEYSNDGTREITSKITQARNVYIDHEIALGLLTEAHLTPALGGAIMSYHLIEEARPVETLWDLTTAVTAYARDHNTNTNDRVQMERIGGNILDLATID